MKRRGPEEYEGEEPPLFAFRDTLAVARDRVFGGLDEGIRCPCCTQFCKAYTRRINSGMARSLIWLVRTWRAGDPESWIHIPSSGPRYVLANRELARFTFWEMVQARFNEDKSKRDSGYWRPTDLGISFAMGESRAPRWVKLYDNGIRAWSEGAVGIRDALGEHFDYDELMHGQGGG